ncbi:MAG: SRPBCC family protein [Sphingomonadales bacterium]|nr:SRPBCC family protein [Sphingomonadales bacterium]
MRLDNSFFLDMTPDEAWVLLNDVERIAPCVPGAQLTDVAGDTYGGKVKVKIGPITAEYKGKATITARDAAARRLTLTGKGQDVRGQGTAGADLEMLVTPEGAGSRVTLGTELQITGKVAQLGKGVMQDVSARLVDQFVANLKALAPAAPVSTPMAAPAASAPAEVAAAPAPRLINAPEAAPVDLVKLSGGALFSRDLLVGGWMAAVLVLLVLIALK